MNDYETLGLEPGASPAEIERARNFLIRALHPDRFTGKPKLQAEAENRMKKVNAAYDRLVVAQRSRPWVAPDPRTGNNPGPHRATYAEHHQEQQERDRREQERIQREQERIKRDAERRAQEAHTEQQHHHAEEPERADKFRIGRWVSTHPQVPLP